MILIPLASLEVAPNRQRREFSQAALQELATSIAATGLLQAPVVRQEGSRWILVAGERRLRAITDLHELGTPFSYGGKPVPAGQVPAVTLGELDTLAAWEAELEENIRRVDLTWQERAKATAQLLELRRAQAEEAGTPPPTISDIAREVRPESTEGKSDGQLGSASTDTRNEVILAKFLHDPEVAAASTAKEAFKILKRKEETRKNVELATTLGSSFSSKSHTLLNADSLEWMRAAAPEQFGVILTDPPYGMGAHEFGNSGVGDTAREHFYEDSYDAWLQIMSVFPQEAYRLAKPEAHAYVFCDLDRFPELRERMSAAGWRAHRTPLIWHNPDGFRAPWPEHGPQRKYELILFAVKGDRKVNFLKGDVLEFGKDKGVGHPAAKPVTLLSELLRRSAKPGDRVFDPFAGSASTVLAAHEHKLPCTAIEQDKASFGLAASRVAALSSFDEGLF